MTDPEIALLQDEVVRLRVALERIQKDAESPNPYVAKLWELAGAALSKNKRLAARCRSAIRSR